MNNANTENNDKDAELAALRAAGEPKMGMDPDEKPLPRLASATRYEQMVSNWNCVSPSRFGETLPRRTRLTPTQASKRTDGVIARRSPDGA